MKIHSLFRFLLLPVVFLLHSCGGSVTTNDSEKADSAVVSVSEELKKLNEQLNANPNNADVLHERAKYYLGVHKYKEGLEDMTAAIAIDSSKATYFLTLSDLYFISNKTSNTKAALEKSIQLDDKNTDAMLKLAELYLYVRKYEESMKYINMALKIDKYDAKAYFMKGMNYKELKDTVKAISSMQTAIEQDQQYYHAYIQLGTLCAATQNPLAAQYFKNATKISPSSVEAWYNLGKYYQDEGAFQNALEAYNMLIRIDVNNLNAYYNMGVIHLLHLKKYDEAINYFTTVIKLNPKYVQAYYSRAVTFQAKGDLKNAKADFQACVDIDPRFEPASIALRELARMK
jgi:tetratricopeptide (TPR) repeat protein